MTTDQTLLRDYLEWLVVEKGRSRATIEAYRRDGMSFISWLGERELDLSHVSTEQLEAFVNEQRQTKAASSVARITSSIKGLLGFLLEEQIIAFDASTRLAPSRRGRSLPKALDESIVDRLIESVHGTDAVSLRDRALFEMLYGTGARVSEVTTLSVGDLDFDEELIRVTGKGSKQRLVPMGQALGHSLRRYLSAGGRSELAVGPSTDRLFLNHRGGPLSRQGVDLILRTRSLAAGVSPSIVSAHVFRHSCATHMLAHGADIRVVQELLGHASIATTQVYTAVSVVSLQRAYLSAHPRAHG
jgi:integrase/recombinase XerD